MQSMSIARSNPVKLPVACILIFVLALAAGFFILPGTNQEKAADNSPNDRFGAAEVVFNISTEDIDESSGLIPSVHHPGCFWTHNDSGAKKGLFLVGLDGEHLATVQIKKADERDWESIARVRRDDRDMIAIGDLGDNLAQYESCQIYLIDEPRLKINEKTDTPVKDAVPQVLTISFRFPDGPQDCEAMAFDNSGQRFWFVSKRRPGGAGASIAGGKNGALAKTAIHYLDFPAAESASKSTLTATRINTEFNELFVTGMDISSDDHVAVIRTPFQSFLFDREENQSWEDVFSGLPSAVSVLPFQRQGESICFSLDGKSIWLTSEGVGQPAWRIPLNSPNSK